MEDTLFPTGSVVFDTLLSGYEGGIITTIYGPSGTGKTTTCLLAAIATIRSGKKVIFVDTEGSFSTFRFQQLLAGEDMRQYLEKIFILKPMTFADQSKAMQRLKDLVNESIGLIIVDSISTLYRAELAKNEGVKASNSDLGLQLFYLNNICRKWNIPALITNQVYADFEERDQVKMVGGDILKYGSKCLIALEKYKTVRKAIIVKHRSQPENKMILFSIVEGGFALFEEHHAA
ncbi:DNA repair and recombination protein RadB, partial [Candidatus Woesearchaeota archaeon]|nr:DNA repair and recombination protein RadB [Candidatus Woesearchaeota archaeon]